MARIIEVKRRKCGVPKEGGVYITGGEGSADGTAPAFFLLEPPVPFPAKFFRGARLVDGSKILANADIRNWWVGSSEETEQQKSSEEYWEGIFGMTPHRRGKLGVCIGTRSSEEALAVLASRVRWDDRIRVNMHVIAKEGIHKHRLVLPAYNQLIEASARAGTTGGLVEMVAATWRMAYLIPPSTRMKYIPTLVRLLGSLGVKEDGHAMLKIFLGGN